MKNLNFILLFILLLSAKCEDDDKMLDAECGCESETIGIVPDENIDIPTEQQTKGKLFYKNEGIDDLYFGNDFDNMFWIFQETSGCRICETYYIVCNDDIFESKYDYLKNGNVQDSVDIEFSGGLKRFCIPRASPVAFRYALIELIQTEI